MMIRFEKEPLIDNLRNYSPEIVAKLRALLASGAEARPDPHRKNFYDVANGSRMFYIHVAPSGKVLLLASWSKPQSASVASQSELASCSSAR
jgi:hypothetical protein